MGSVIVQKLVELVPPLRIIVLDKIDIGNGPLPLLQYHQADITVLEEVTKVFRATRPDAIIHTAGLIPPLNERYQRRLEKVVFDVNVNGTKNVLHAGKEVGCKVFVYTSSCCAG